MAGPNLVSFQGTANTQNPNTSEIPVSAANPLPVTLGGNLTDLTVGISQGTPGTTNNVSLSSAANVPALFVPSNGDIPFNATVDLLGVAAIPFVQNPSSGNAFGAQQWLTGLNSTGLGVPVMGLAAQAPEASPTVVTAGQVGNLYMGPSNHALYTQTVGDTYVNLSADGIASVKSTPGIVKAVTINTKGTVASTVTIKDGANTVAVIDSLNLSGTFNLNAVCTANITATLTGTVAPNVTVTYQ